ncbi:MAG: hypothetical protein AAGD25_19830 [Cyanobacteria bacterium P01_F01_bin.150]
MFLAQFTASTATGIEFDGGGWLNVMTQTEYESLVGTPNSLAFGVSELGFIINAGTITAGGDLSLLGGSVLNIETGSLTASNIVVAAVPGENLVSISQLGNLLSLEIQPITDPALLDDGAVSIAELAELLTGGVISDAVGD